MYVKIRNNVVLAIIPDFVPEFPNVPVSQRYSADFLNTCLYFSDDTDVQEGYEYVPETRSFRSTVNNGESLLKVLESMESAISTLNSELTETQAQLEQSIESNALLEECLVEMANIVYA